MKHLKIFKQDAKITSFICSCYCQSCDNNNCNMHDIMDKYQSNELTPLQVKEVNKFNMINASCSNHVLPNGFDVLMHKIKIYYKDKTSKEMPGWFSAHEISGLWDSSVSHIDILFTDI